jgi:transposase
MQTSFAEIPDELWERIQAWIPKRRRGAKGGRPPIADRRALSGILYRLRTGCQWDAIPSEFGSRSTCYRRFVEWTKAGVFKMMHVEMLLYYDEKRGIDWNWCSLDSASVKAPKGGASPVPILQIVESLARNATSSPTVAASPSQSR